MGGVRALADRWYRGARSYAAAILHSTPLDAAPARWLKRPVIRSGEEVCLFVTYAPGGCVPPHSLYHARAWSAAGFKLVLIVALDEGQALASDIDFGGGLMTRLNRGYDFGGWAAAIDALPELRRARRLALVNDSIYGPLAGFEAMLARVRASRADLIGSVESYEVRRHFQSFLLFFGEGALASAAFWRFWRRVRNGSREFAVYQYETRLLERMTGKGLSAEALFPAAPGDMRNLTLTDWKGLIRAGFPFVKARLLRDNPDAADLAGWRRILTDAGYPVALIDDHLGERAPADGPGSSSTAARATIQSR